ncbi:MAG: PDZ domain-containing protein, partial [Firmicutes bacterium]|nr:PDZ domain-containing protein [Bacillota bacterium]
IIFSAVPAYASTYVVPSGQTAGIKIYTDGLIVTDVSDFYDAGGNSVCPASDAGIDVGDVIKSVNGSEITSCEQFAAMLDGGSLELEIIDDGQTSSAAVTPVLGEDGAYHIGAWVRDSTAGIGTITCYDPETLQFYALGHAVTDVDTGNIMTVESGNIQECTISDVAKGYMGFPGYVSADFGSEIIGTIEKNSDIGISGQLKTALSESRTVEAAGIDEVRDGAASVLTDICGGAVEEYSAEIKVISQTDTRSMIIEITDSRLIEATGGIVQGMSGAPVMQDGRLIGAVTHVFVNDPRKGYCISADKLLS